MNQTSLKIVSTQHAMANKMRQEENYFDRCNQFKLK